MLSNSLAVCLSFSLSFSLSVTLSLSFTLCLLLFLSVCLSLSLSLSLPLSLFFLSLSRPLWEPGPTITFTLASCWWCRPLSVQQLPAGRYLGFSLVLERVSSTVFISSNSNVHWPSLFSLSIINTINVRISLSIVNGCPRLVNDWHCMSYIFMSFDFIITSFWFLPLCCISHGFFKLFFLTLVQTLIYSSTEFHQPFHPCFFISVYHFLPPKTLFQISWTAKFSFCLSWNICLCVCPSICTCLSLLKSLSGCLSYYLSVSLSLSLSLPLSLSLSLSLSLKRTAEITFFHSLSISTFKYVSCSGPTLGSTSTLSPLRHSVLCLYTIIYYLYLSLSISLCLSLSFCLCFSISLSLSIYLSLYSLFLPFSVLSSLALIRAFWLSFSALFVSSYWMTCPSWNRFSLFL